MCVRRKEVLSCRIPRCFSSFGVEGLIYKMVPIISGNFCQLLRSYLIRTHEEFFFHFILYQQESCREIFLDLLGTFDDDAVKTTIDAA